MPPDPETIAGAVAVQVAALEQRSRTAVAMLERERAARRADLVRVLDALGADYDDALGVDALLEAALGTIAARRAGA